MAAYKTLRRVVSEAKLNLALRGLRECDPALEPDVVRRLERAAAEARRELGREMAAEVVENYFWRSIAPVAEANIRRPLWEAIKESLRGTRR